MTEEDFATLLALCECFMYLQAKHPNDVPPPGERARRALAALVNEAPPINCPRVMRFTGVANQHVNSNIREFNAPTRAQWVTVEQAGELLDLKPNSVRWLLRQGKLTGKRNARGNWRVDAQSVARYKTRRTAA